MENQENAKKIAKLIQDRDFLVKLNEAKTDREAGDLFLSKGVKLDTEKLKVIKEIVGIAMKKVNTAMKKIDEIELDKVVGGVKLDSRSVKTVVISVLMSVLAVGLVYEGVRIGEKVDKLDTTGGKIKSYLVENFTGNTKLDNRSLREKIEDGIAGEIYELLYV